MNKIVSVIFIFLLSTYVWSADRYVIPDGGTSNNTATWSATSGGAGGASVPVSGDNVFLDANSGPLMITADLYCGNFDCTGYTGTITHTNYGIRPYGNLVLSTTMTYSTSGNAYIMMPWLSPSITTNGKTINNFMVNTTGTVTLLDALTVTNMVTLTAGTFDTNDQTCTWGAFSSSNTNTRALDLGASAIGITGNATAWNIATGTNLTLTAGTSVITCTGSAVQFNAGSKTYNDVRFTGSGTVQINQSGSRFNYLTRTGTASKTDGLDLNTAGGIIITKALTLNGNSAINRLFVFGFDLGDDTVVTLDGGSVVTSDNCDYRDINFSTATDLSAGSVGDCGGNTNITFTAPVDQHWVADFYFNGRLYGNSGNWSNAARWTSRVPLPQDNVFFDVLFFAGRTVTADMPRLGKTIDWTGASGGPTWSIGDSNLTLYGGLTLISGMTLTGNTKTITFEGRGAYTLTSAGKEFPNGQVYIASVGGSITLQDAFSLTGTFYLLNGTFDTNGNTMSQYSFSGTGTTTRALYLRSSTINLTGADYSRWSMDVVTGLTFDAGTSTITFLNNTGSPRYFTGGGLTYYNFVASAGLDVTKEIEIDSSNTFNNITLNAPIAVKFQARRTQTVGSFTAVGTAVNGISLYSDTPGSPATLSDASGLNMLKYCTIKDIAATGGANWVSLLAMENVDVSGNTGWIWNAGLGIIMIND